MILITAAGAAAAAVAAGAAAAAVAAGDVFGVGRCLLRFLYVSNPFPSPGLVLLVGGVEARKLQASLQACCWSVFCFLEKPGKTRISPSRITILLLCAD